MPNWQEEFQSICEEMKRKNESKKFLTDRGEVILTPGLRCSSCNSLGTYLGSDLDYGEFYECASARYCANCHKIYDVMEGVNFASYSQKDFLPIMRKKLIENPNFASSYITGRSCPRCRQLVCAFYKDIGAIDYYDNFWTVCINPACDWPGEHEEKIESGPY